jgi:hypothetical protein
MAKLTYLQLVNRVLKRITQAEITVGVSSATGQAKIISEFINEAQTELWTESQNWYSLYKQRTITVPVYTASTIAFVDGGASPDTITDSANGLAVFSAGQTIVISGSTSNDGVYVITTAAAGTITLQSADALTAESAGASITIHAVTYPVASDWGRSHVLVNVTDNRVMTEDYSRIMLIDDPAMDSFSDPTHFTVQGEFYRFYYIPSGNTKIRDHYWAVPTALSSDSSTSDLPLFCENFIIHWAWMSILEYLNKFEQADRIRVKLYGKDGILGRVKSANQKIVDQTIRFQPTTGMSMGIAPPRLPSNYGVVTGW